MPRGLGVEDTSPPPVTAATLAFSSCARCARRLCDCRNCAKSWGRGEFPVTHPHSLLSPVIFQLTVHDRIMNGGILSSCGVVPTLLRETYLCVLVHARK